VFEREKYGERATYFSYVVSNVVMFVYVENYSICSFSCMKVRTAYYYVQALGATIPISAWDLAKRLF
jgi:hypothetical protein